MNDENLKKNRKMAKSYKGAFACMFAGVCTHVCESA